MPPDLKTLPSPGESAPAAPPAEPAPAVDPVARLRSILLGREREQLRRLEQRLEDADALSPVVTRALTTSVRRDPRPLADALFPVMGPAIRRAISQALAGMMQSVNQALEHTFSLQGLAWRWEALRTGTSFAEVLLRHSLVYRVEQVFLVHRESGLLLQHLSAPAVETQAADMVAGMLTAIQDFARDSFHVGAEEMLEQLQVGELTLWIEQGGRALLAAVIRGHAPVEFRGEMQSVMEELEVEHAAELEDFRGDASAFARSRHRLESLLLEARRKPAARGPWRAWLLLALVLILVAVLATPGILARQRLAAYVQSLRETPGIVVTRVGREGGRFLVEGLRDPQAADPAPLRESAGIRSDQVRERWEPYTALTPEFVVGRAVRALATPGTVTLRLAGDTLVARGVAPGQWYREASRLALALPGVGAWREERMNPRDLPQLSTLVQAVERERVLFETGSASLDSAGRVQTDRMAAALAALDAQSRPLGFGITLFVIGSADEQGAEGFNDRLRRARAMAVLEWLRPSLPAAVGMSTLLEPAVGAAATDEERARRRAVYARVRLEELAPDPALAR